MRELESNEIRDIHGGNPWAWMVLGYVGGKIIDRAASIGGNGLRSSGGQMNRARRYKQP